MIGTPKKWEIRPIVGTFDAVNHIVISFHSDFMVGRGAKMYSSKTTPERTLESSCHLDNQ